MQIRSVHVEMPVTFIHFAITQVEEFLFASEEQRTEVKWRYLLERCKIYFKVLLRY